MNTTTSRYASIYVKLLGSRGFAGVKIFALPCIENPQYGWLYYYYYYYYYCCCCYRCAVKPAR
jgi:hypothetical protein